MTRLRPDKPRIALVVDVDDWAFANIARQVRLHLGNRYDFDIIPLEWLDELQDQRWRDLNRPEWPPQGAGAGLGLLLIQAPRYDLVHVFPRGYLNLIGTPMLSQYARFLGLHDEQFLDRYLRPSCVTTGVYDHLFSDADGIRSRRRVFNQVVAAYSVCSEKLARLYAAAESIRAPAAVIEDGVDLTLFRPADLDRFDTAGTREIVVGWAGNSAWLSEVEDFKGLHTILRPAVEQLRMEGERIRLHLADRQAGQRPHAEMPAYYAGLDVYVCASKIEGTPNPVLEAMACGVPVISTDVGIVPQAFGPQQRDFILAERSVECLKQALRRLLAQPRLFHVLSRENQASIRGWSWQAQATKFDAFFAAVLEQRNAAPRPG